MRKLGTALALTLSLSAAPIALADHHEGKEESCQCQKGKKCECKGDSGCACAKDKKDKKDKKAKKEKKADQKTEDHSAH